MTAPKVALEVGVDVGGTFTDLVAVDAARGRFYRAKVLTSPEDPLAAILEGIMQITRQASCGPEAVNRIVHGTTLVGNSLIQRTGVSMGLLTTRGHRDTLEMGNEFRYDLYDLTIQRAEPLVPRYRRIGITERIDAEGTVVLALAEEEVLAAAAGFLDAGVETVAIGFLHSFRNPTHERQAAAIIAQRFPDLSLTLSSDVAPEIREYERFSTAVARDRPVGSFWPRASRRRRVSNRLWRSIWEARQRS